MLDLDAVDLELLDTALEDHSYDEMSWWIHPETGEVRQHIPEAYSGIPETEEDLEDEGFVAIDPRPSGEGYRDMQDFIAAMPSGRPADLLERAIEGRGAFRRFKDTLFELPELRHQWFAFHDARLRRRAVEWLWEHDCIDESTAQTAIAAHQDPPVVTPEDDLPRAVAADLQVEYGDRLVAVYVYGSRARGDYDEESDLDLLVVLDDLESGWQELSIIEDITWKHTDRSGVVVVPFPVSAAQFAEPDEPVVARAREEGRRVA